MVVTQPKNWGCNYSRFLSSSLCLCHSSSSLHLAPHNNIYCHSTMYCQKAFVPSMCAHCFTYCQLMLNPGRSFFPSSFLFGISAIWLKWPPLQLVSLQLWHFMNCCTVHWRCSYYHLIAFHLPEKFSAFRWQIISSLQGKRIASLTTPSWKQNLFFSFWNFYYWCLIGLFCRWLLSNKLISKRFELTFVKCLVLFLLTWFDYVLTRISIEET